MCQVQNRTTVSTPIYERMKLTLLNNEHGVESASIVTAYFNSKRLVLDADVRHSDGLVYIVLHAYNVLSFPLLFF